jgi:hypothetical protein
MSPGPVHEIDNPAPDEVGPSARAWLERLPGPCVVRVTGRDRSRRRAVGALLHGNEPSGLVAVHRLLRSGAPPVTDLVCFLGAVDAAREPPGFAHRALPGARDLNRCFAPPFEGAEGRLAEAMLEVLDERPTEALVDLHNNTGHNPAYGVSRTADAAHCALVALFAGTCVVTDLSLGALFEVADQRCPAVVIECGLAGASAADEVAAAGLARFAAAPSIAPEAEAAMRVLSHPLRVELRPGARVRLQQSRAADVALTLHDEIDRHNFERVEAGTAIGWIGAGAAWPLQAMDGSGRDRSREFFTVDADGALRAARPLVPIMMTTNAQVAMSDCLFYLVRPEEVHDRTVPGVGG